MIALSVGEVCTKRRYLLCNQSLLGPSHSDMGNLANWVLVLLLTSLTGKNKVIHLCRKSVFNLKADKLHKFLLSCLEKSKGCNFEIMPTIMDGASMSNKVGTILLKELSSNIEGKLKLEASFTHNG